MAHAEYSHGDNEMAESGMGRREFLKAIGVGVLALGTTAVAGVVITKREEVANAVGELVNRSKHETQKARSEFSVSMPPGFTCTSSCTTFELEGFSREVGNITKDERGERLRIVFEYKTRLTVPATGNDTDAQITVEFVQSAHQGSGLPPTWSLTKTEGGRTTVGAALSAEEWESILRGIDLAMNQLHDVHTAEAELGSWSKDRHPAFTAFALSEGKKQLQGGHATSH